MRRIVPTLLALTMLAHSAAAATPETASPAAPASAKNTTRVARETTITPGGATWRSAVLPGWGQRYKGERKKGWIFTGAFGVLALGTLGTVAEAQSADRAYTGLSNGASNTQFDAAYQRDVQARLAAEIFAGATTAVWAWAVADSRFNGVDAMRIKDARLHDIFPAQMKFWQTNNFASIVVENRSADPITNVKVRLEAPQVMSLPADAPVVETILPGLAREISMRASFSDSVFEIGRSEPRSVQARVVVEYEIRHKRKRVERTATFTVYNGNAIVWDDIRKLASFVTPREAAVSTFASEAARRKTAIYPVKNLAIAAAYFDAMSAAGIVYLSDPETPFAQLEGNAAAVDTVSFPHETLVRHTGDCDDLTALYASLLESSGVPAALVDVPGHVFVMFDSGLKPDEFRRQMGSDSFVVRNGSAWVPVETTALGKPFGSAWSSGLEEARKWIGLQKFNAVEVLASQAIYPATIPVFAPGTIATIDGAAFDRLVAMDTTKASTLGAASDKSIAELKARKLPPDQEANEIGVFLAKQGQYKIALTYFQKALSINPGLAKAKNNLGNVALMLGDKKAALKAYQEALDVSGENAPVLANLAALYYDLGEPVQAIGFYQRAIKVDPAYEMDYPELAALAAAQRDSATALRGAKPGAPETTKASPIGDKPDSPPGKFIP